MKEILTRYITINKFPNYFEMQKMFGLSVPEMFHHLGYTTFSIINGEIFLYNNGYTKIIYAYTYDNSNYESPNIKIYRYPRNPKIVIVESNKYGRAKMRLYK